MKAFNFAEGQKDHKLLISKTDKGDCLVILNRIDQVSEIETL